MNNIYLLLRMNKQTLSLEGMYPTGKDGLRKARAQAAYIKEKYQTEVFIATVKESFRPSESSLDK